DSRSAPSAKTLRDLAAFIAEPFENFRIAAEKFNALARESRLRAERAARPFLAFKAMTDGYAHRLAETAQANVAAGATGLAQDH
ncbi:MAG TPA: hypothetical protein PKM48_09325, partial [Parvularculaceae bacterium]|nr:hypothetical protein [Parvularculaceae bacterium]